MPFNTRLMYRGIAAGDARDTLIWHDDRGDADG
jgi:hypothetical protein